MISTKVLEFSKIDGKLGQQTKIIQIKIVDNNILIQFLEGSGLVCGKVHLTSLEAIEIGKRLMEKASTLAIDQPSE